MPPGRPSVVPMGVLTHVRDNIYKIRVPYRDKSRNQYFIKTNCAMCGKETLKSRLPANREHQKRYQKRYCSPECRNLGRLGELNSNWRGGVKNKRGKSGGHILEYAPEHPHARKGFVAQHRLVMEKIIGRYLLSTELIHHIDCDMQNNAPENLVITNINEHNTSHGSLEKCVKRLLQMGALKFNMSTMEYEVIDEWHSSCS